MANDSSILINCSKEFKEAVAKYATEHNMDVSPFIRQCVATAVGYDITKDMVARGRKKIYDTPEDKAAARRERKITEQAMLEMYEHDEHIRTVIALRDSLLRKGVNPTDE